MTDIFTKSGRKDMLSFTVIRAICKLDLFDGAWKRIKGKATSDVDDDYFDSFTLILDMDTIKGYAPTLGKTPLNIISIHGALDGYGVTVIRKHTRSTDYAEKTIAFEDLSEVEANADAIVQQLLDMSKGVPSYRDWCAS